MASLVREDPTLLLGDDAALLKPADDPLERRLEVRLRDVVAVVTRGEDRCLVRDVGQVGAGQPGGLARDEVKVDVGREGLAPRVNSQDLLAAGEIRRRDEDLAVEPAGPEQGRVEVLEPVRSTHDDHLAALAPVEPVQLDEQLVQRLVLLPVEAAAHPLHSDGVELVDEDDRRSVVPGLLEELPDAAAPRPANISTNADALCE